ncbi:MAG: hypothetical protein ACXV3U_08655 [Halobacteriota archaeon]
MSYSIQYIPLPYIPEVLDVEVIPVVVLLVYPELWAHGQLLVVVG